MKITNRLLRHYRQNPILFARQTHKILGVRVKLSMFHQPGISAPRCPKARNFTLIQLFQDPDRRINIQ